MSDTTSPPSVHLHPLSPSSSMSSTDSAPQSEPTSDEQPDLGAFTTVLRAWTYLQPPPRIPVQIHSPTTSTTTTFQPDQSVVDSDFQSSSHAPSSSFIRPPSNSVLHEESTVCSTALPPSSSFTRPPSSSVHEESTVWNHAPIASYLYSGTPSIERITDEDENSVGSTEGGRTVEINSELSFDDHSSSVPSQPPYLDAGLPVPLEPTLLLPPADSSDLLSHLRNITRNPLPSSSYSSTLSLLSYQIPESPPISESDLLVVAQRLPSAVVSTVTDSTSLKAQKSSNVNSMTTPTSGPPLPIQQQRQHRTVLIHPPTQTISDDASVSHLSLPPPVDSPIPTNLHPPHTHPNPTHAYLSQQQPPASLPQARPPRSGIDASASHTRNGSGGGQGTIVVDDLTPDQTPESFVVDWKRSGRTGGFRPIDDDDREEVGEKRSRACGYGLGFAFGRTQQKHVSGYTSNYEGSQSSFRARKTSEMKSRSTRLEPQNEDNEDSNFNSDVPEHRYDEEDKDKDREDEGEERNDYPFPDHRHRGRFNSQTYTPKYYGRTYTPPRGVLPPQHPQSMGQTQTSMEVLRGLAYDRVQPPVQPQSYADSHQQLYSHHTDLHSHPDPYPRPHARPHAQDRDRDTHSSHSPSSSIPSSSPFSHIEPSPIQRDYVLVQPQTPLTVPIQLSLQSFSQHSQTQAQTSNSISYLSSQNQGSSSTTTMTTTTLPPIPVPVPVSVPVSAIPTSIPPPAAASILPSAPAPSSYSNVYQGQGVVMSQDHNDLDAPLLLLSSASSNKHDLPPLSSPSPSSSPALLSIEKVPKPDKVGKAGTTDKPGKPDKLEKTSQECVDSKDAEIAPVSVSGRSSSGGGDVGAGGSGLGANSGQTLTKCPAMKQSKQQQQRRQLELQFQQSDEQTGPHVESDSGGSKDGGGTTTVGASVVEVITTASMTTAPSETTATTTTTTADSLLPNPNPIPLSIPIPIPIPIPNLDADRDPNPNPKSLPRTYNHPKHSHSQSDSHYHPHHSYQGFHSDSYVAHVEDTTDYDLDLDLNDGLDDDVGISADTIRRVGLGGGGGGAGGDALLPSLGYLDEALSFIAAERARWSAAREGSGAGSGSPRASGNPGAGVASKRTEDWKVLDYDMDTPKRKRRRKRRQHQQQPILSSSNSGLVEVPPPNAADEDGGGPSTLTSSTKKVRSSSWSPTKKKNGSNSKGKEKEFLIAPSQPPLDSASAPLLPPAISVQGARDQLAGDGGGVISRSGQGGLLFVKEQGFGKQDEDGGRTPTNGSGVVKDVFGPVNTASMNMSGKRRKTGKKERERVRKDLLIGKEDVGKVTNPGHAVDEIEYEEDDDNEGDNDEDDALSHDDLSVEGDSSLNDLSILQPPHSRHRLSRRKRGKDIAHIHSRAGIAGGGAYKSTPGSPKGRREFDDINVDQENGGHGYESLGDEDVDDHVGGDGGVPDIAPRKRTAKRRLRGLVRVRSVPQLRSDAEEPMYAAEETVTVPPGKLKPKKAKSKAAAAAATTSTLTPALNGRGGGDLPDVDQPQTKRSRLITLAKKLRQLFPEQRLELRRVSAGFEKQGLWPRGKGKKAFLTSGSAGGGVAPLTVKPPSISVPGARKSRRSSHQRAGSESASADIDHEDGDAGDGDGTPEIEEDKEIDPRGRPPKKSDVLIHVFIDHSNILIGLLSHLRRLPVPHAGSKGTKRGVPLPTIPAKATPTTSMSHVTTPELTFAAVKPTNARPLPNPNTTGGTGKASANASSSSISIAVPSNYHHLIPLPSFATVSRSLPSGSVLNEYLVENDDGSQIEEKNGHSDSYEYYQGDDEYVDDLGQITSLAEARKPKEKEKKLSKHLWHAALVLLLERGRPVTRRVIVTSSPLYQSMDGIERLGYELRVYIRVPDLGNGMDRDRRKDRSGSFNGGSKSVQSSPSTSNTVSFAGLSIPAKEKRQVPGHVRRISGSTSAESGGGGSGHASGGAIKIHPYFGIANNTPPHGKIKYREQGVDELLQLKLHQALAATDNVPEGSTIVLATGDGNMGQFNEEGFLGPVRTALRRGWKVELYAWEDGLSRAWRREFGEGTEWGRRGMFRIIGMEQFAGSLVEVIEQ